jgi:predicted DNA-binding helix-hairpin-helix protein
LQQPARFPVEINTAEKAELLRVPGIGPLSAERILAMRTKFPFKTMESLKQTGAVVSRARDFVTIDGRYYGAPAELLYKAGQYLRQAANLTGEQPNLRQLSLPLEWKLENLLPLRQSVSAAELAFD